MKKKLIYINVFVLLLFFVPTVLFRFNSHYECHAGMFGTFNKKFYTSQAPKYKKAAALAIEQCKLDSERPDQCDVLTCKNYFF